jgi:hypothetical protein
MMRVGSMDPSVFLTGLGVGAAVTSLLTAIRSLRVKMNAKKGLIITIGSDSKRLDRLDTLLKEVVSSKDAEERTRSKELLENEMRHIVSVLPSADQRQVADGLFQPSEKGRIGYIEQVIAAAKAEDRPKSSSAAAVDFSDAEPFGSS